MLIATEDDLYIKYQSIGLTWKNISYSLDLVTCMQERESQSEKTRATNTNNDYNVKPSFLANLNESIARKAPKN